MANSRRGNRPLVRGNLYSNPRDRRHRSGHERGGMKASRNFFVPSFSVRRSVLATEEMKDFHSWLESYFKRKPYEVTELGRMGLLLMEQKGFINLFHQADIQPEAVDVLAVAENMREGLRENLKSKPRNMPMLAGGIHRSGGDNKIVISPRGWKGYRASYARRSEHGNLQFNSQLVQEANIVVGSVANGFRDGLNSFGAISEIDARPLAARTPHVAIGRKSRGGKISNDEIVDLEGNILERMPDSLSLFDPVIHLKLQPGSTPVIESYDGQPSDYDPIMFVRNPKLRDYGHMLMSISNN